MTESELYHSLLLLMFILCPIVAFLLFYIKAPYGRYVQRSWGAGISVRSGWIVMEIVALLSFDAAFLTGTPDLVAWIFFILWNIHYGYRGLIYPLRLPNQTKQIPVLIVASGTLFNMINGYLNGRFLSVFGAGYSLDWLTTIPFLLGIALFFTGFLTNVQSDTILLSLRRADKSAYQIPRGFLFNYVSCPNYLGEVVEWFGWAMATWSLPGLAFALFTAANLMPRAYSHHHWYQQTFQEYPKDRKAIVPFIF